jgi:hypothetical protein
MSDQETKYDVEKAIEGQKLYWAATGAPQFAPSNGICFSCKEQIYNRISVKEATTKLVTGCPYCNRSWCD